MSDRVEAHISSEPMRLVIDVANIAKKGVVHLCIGGLTFPITREDLVTLLFGGETQTDATQSYVVSGTQPRQAEIKDAPVDAGEPSLDDEIDNELSKLRKSGRLLTRSERGSQVSNGVNARFADRSAKGICYADCARKVVPGKSYCKVHLKRMGQGMLKARSMRGVAKE